MPSPRKRLVVGWVLLIACSGLSLPWAPADSIQSPQLPPPTSSPPPNPRIEPFRLDLRRKARRSLDRQVVHRYAFDLRSGQALDAVVDQEGVDVVIQLFAPGGQKLFLVDSPNDGVGPEEVFLVAKSAGTYYAEVRSSGSGGSYQIWVRSLRTARPADRIHAQAEELFYKAREHKDDHPVEAIAQFLEAERLWRRVGNSRRRANALERTGTIYCERFKDWDRALKYQTQSLNLYRAISDRKAEAWMLVSIGVTRRQFGDLLGADQCYRQALNIASRSGFLEAKASALMNLGLLLRLEGDHWGALENLESARQIWATIRRKDKEIEVLNNLGMIHMLFGQHQTALSYFQRAFDLIGPTDYDLRAQTLTRLSDLYERMEGGLSRALVYAKQALQFRQRAQDHRGEAVTLTTIGLILRSQGDLTSARDSTEQALAIVRSISDKAGEASAYMNLGLIVLDQKDPRTALEHFTRALDLARGQGGYRDVEVRALYGIAQAERLRGNPINTRAALEQIPELVEDLLKGGGGGDNPEDFLKIRQQSYDLLVDLLVRSPAGNTPQADLARTFEANERSRWRNLLEAVNPTQAREGFSQRANPALLAERTRLREALSQLADERRRQEHKGKKIPRRLVLEQEGLAERLRTAETRFRLSDPWAGVASRTVPISLKEAQGLLDSDTALLEYRLGRERSFLWLVTSDSAAVFTLPPGVSLEEDAERLHEYLSDSRFGTRQDQAVPVAERLSKVLLGPVVSRLKGRKLVIVRDGALHYIPFAALPDPEGRMANWQGDWPCPLIMRHDIVYLPSVSVLEAIRAEVSHRKPQPGNLAALADPKFVPGDYSPLPKSREEALKILKLVPGGKTFSAFGTEATRDLVMSGKLSQYRMLHFATHAENNLRYPELSSIILSQLDSANGSLNGRLRFQDIRDLNLPADLVVLSACKTALGKDVKGEGPVGLAQAFMYAGAARVVVSLWDVFENSTPTLMERFYRELLLNGRAPSAALNSAQRWMAQQPDWKSPYYWASFELQGEWR